MKKTIIFLLIICSLVMLPACGEDDAAELPTVTAPPRTEEQEQWLLSAMQRPVVGDPDYVEPDSEGYRIAKSMIGKDLKDLIKRIGEPIDFVYGASCIAPGSGAEDGTLYYEDFTVSTVRYPSGKETIMGAY